MSKKKDLKAEKKLSKPKLSYVLIETKRISVQVGGNCLILIDLLSECGINNPLSKIGP